MIEEYILVFFRNFAFISSTPDADDSLRFSIILTIPGGSNTIGNMGKKSEDGSTGWLAPKKSLKTLMKLSLKVIAQSSPEITSPPEFLSCIKCLSAGLTKFQNCFGLLVSIEGNFMLKKLYLVSSTANLYTSAAEWYAAQRSGDIDDLAARNKRFFLLDSLFKVVLYQGDFEFDLTTRQGM